AGLGRMLVVADVHGVAISELARVVIPPAANGALGRQRTAVAVADDDGLGLRPQIDVDRLARASRGRLVDPLAQAERTRGVRLPPTSHGAGAGHRATVAPDFQ